MSLSPFMARRYVKSSAEMWKEGTFEEEHIEAWVILQAGAGFEPATNGFAIRPIRPLWHPAGDVDSSRQDAWGTSGAFL